jgi:catalase-peroxidase
LENSFRTGKGEDISSGLEGAWSATPTKWSNNYFENFGFEWELTKSPGVHISGNLRWLGAGTVPDAHNPSKSHAPFMLTSDLALSGSYL